LSLGLCAGEAGSLKGAGLKVSEGWVGYDPTYRISIKMQEVAELVTNVFRVIVYRKVGLSLKSLFICWSKVRGK
jgi:hypothetical protein